MTSGAMRLTERLEQKLDDECAQGLNRWQQPFEVRARSGSFHPHEDTIKVMTMHTNKGLEFPVVALMGVGQMPAAGKLDDDCLLWCVVRTGLKKTYSSSFVIHPRRTDSELRCRTEAVSFEPIKYSGRNK